MSVKFSTKELQRIIAQPGYGIVNGELPDNVPSRRNKFNAMLQTGSLGFVLASARQRACKTDDEARRLFYNINDAIAQRHMDVGACEVAMQIADKLGIKL